MSRSLQLLGQSLPSPRGSSSSLRLAAKGFRPFFLLAAAFASAVIPLWLLIVGGRIAVAGYWDPLSWHAHEMLFGFALAVVAGFLLTAVGNWTQRETLVGPPLLALCALWLAGRVCVLVATSLPVGLAAAVDLSFLPALAIAIGRPIAQTRNRRNFVMVGLLLALFVINACMHAEPLGVLPRGSAHRASLVAVDLVILLIAIMAGRTFPMFTRNATGVTSIRSIPALDSAALAALAVLTLLDAVAPASIAAPVVAALAAALAVARAIHWGARHAFGQPLLWILHVGYAWIPVGLLLRAVGGPGLVAALGTHALTLGALASLTLGMMARVSLGHTGRPLAAPKPMTIAFAAITAAALARVVVPLVAPSLYLQSLYVAGALWTLSFSLFVWAYAPILVRARADGKPG